MKRGRIGPAVTSAAKRVGNLLVEPWVWGSLMGVAALMLVASP